MEIERRNGLKALVGAAALAALPGGAAGQSRAETLRQVTGNTINTLDLTAPGSTREQRWNFSNFNNPEINALTQAAQFELDPEKYHEMCRRMIAILGAETPELFLWQPNHEAVMASKIEGYTYQMGWTAPSGIDVPRSGS